MNSDFSDFIRFFPIFRLFPTFRLLDSTTLVSTIYFVNHVTIGHDQPTNGQTETEIVGMGYL